MRPVPFEDVAERAVDEDDVLAEEEPFSRTERTTLPPEVVELPLPDTVPVVEVPVVEVPVVEVLRLTVVAFLVLLLLRFTCELLEFVEPLLLLFTCELLEFVEPLLLLFTCELPV